MVYDSLISMSSLVFLFCLLMYTFPGLLFSYWLLFLGSMASISLDGLNDPTSRGSELWS